MNSSKRNREVSSSSGSSCISASRLLAQVDCCYIFIILLTLKLSSFISECHSPLARPCPAGAPLQWRPYLDAPSKAYLSPAIVVGQLREVRLKSHPNDINSAGILFEASFSLSKILKSPQRIDLRPNETIRLLYRTNSISPLMATIAHESMQLASSANFRQQQVFSPIRSSSCASDLQEFDSLKFKLNKNYVLFLDQYEQPQFVKSLYPFAQHERLTNETSRALRRILFERPAARAPQVQLLNGTVVSVLMHQQQQQQQQVATPTSASGKIRLDCKVSGFPVAWVQWYRNGRLLRNKPGRLLIKTTRLVRPAHRRQVQLSRLELELRAGRNESGVYECRAMSVVAREPSVGAYSLLVLPGQRQFALIPMQPIGQPTQFEWSQPMRPLKATSQTTVSTPPISKQSNKLSTFSATTATAATTTTASTTVAPSLTSSTATTIMAKLPYRTRPTTATPTSYTTPMGPVEALDGGGHHSNSIAHNDTSDEKQQVAITGLQQGSTTSGGQTPMVDQPCPIEVANEFCLNKGTCLRLAHIGENYCSCAKGYHGLRCEYKGPSHHHQP